MILDIITQEEKNSLSSLILNWFTHASPKIILLSPIEVHYVTTLQILMELNCLSILVIYRLSGTILIIFIIYTISVICFIFRKHHTSESNKSSPYIYPVLSKWLHRYSSFSLTYLHYCISKNAYGSKDYMNIPMNPSPSNIFIYSLLINNWPHS